MAGSVERATKAADEDAKGFGGFRRARCVFLKDGGKIAAQIIRFNSYFGPGVGSDESPRQPAKWFDISVELD